MGCVGSSQAKAEGSVKQVKKPRSWKHPQPITISQLIQLREEFWDTAPHYGGRKEIWDALRAAAEADPKLSQVIIESAGIILQNPDMTVCFDERGNTNSQTQHLLSVCDFSITLILNLHCCRCKI
ncbi:ubiquitin domain-containing protein 1-like isoform X1 [Salvia hispanica]|uniref:ubiquitin domain-containing protein 1-like isoform X1 n=1 Tax=Salvia hispanica TaxID=49212 RepID=UPI0020097D7A|nr:ubiquitin domain-containing protein 1-like isoform X1 [Salvia hispanica]